jgi:hypothetical protein
MLKRFPIKLPVALIELLIDWMVDELVFRIPLPISPVFDLLC